MSGDTTASGKRSTIRCATLRRRGWDEVERVTLVRNARRWLVTKWEWAIAWSLPPQQFDRHGGAPWARAGLRFATQGGNSSPTGTAICYQPIFQGIWRSDRVAA